MFPLTVKLFLIALAFNILIIINDIKSFIYVILKLIKYIFK